MGIMEVLDIKWEWAEKKNLKTFQFIALGKDSFIRKICSADGKHKWTIRMNSTQKVWVKWSWAGEINGLKVVKVALNWRNFMRLQFLVDG
jgi:hypothetical protein